jgi:REP-associated tyrosine transposase
MENSNLLVKSHFVFAPKYRKPLFEDPKIKGMCKAIFESICQSQGWIILAFEIVHDHLHLFIARPRSVSESTIAQRLKGASSRELRRMFPYLKGVEFRHFWARRYFVEGAGNADQATIKRYIANQESAWNRQHLKTTPIAYGSR